MSKRALQPVMAHKSQAQTGLAAPVSAYPSLKEHLATRRHFLGLTGATGVSLAAGGLLGACTRHLGQSPDPDAQAPKPDAGSPSPDGHIDMPGEMPYPDYFTLRIPVESSLSAYLLDGGYCNFYVEMVTYVEATYLALFEHLATAGDRCRSVLEDLTYDTLSTAAGIAAAEEDLQDELDALVTELTLVQGATVEAVTLNILLLEPYAPMDGGMPEPSYP